MLSSAECCFVQRKRFIAGLRNRQTRAKYAGLVLLFTLIFLEFAPFASSQANAQSYTQPTTDYACQHVGFSADGNPYPLCPGTYPSGGNCTWWAWEQWHLLGYDLPLNWGNAADWAVDAERAGLPSGTTPHVGSIAVFPRADGTWALGPEGHVAFVTAVSADGSSFNVTYQNYGDPTFMYVGTDLNTTLINQPRYQDGQLRFIYFPATLDAQRFARLPGLNNSNPVAAVAEANHQLSMGYGNSSHTTATNDRLALGLAPVSSEQEFNADFTGKGVSDLLLYNRQQGNLSVFSLASPGTSGGDALPQRVSLGDATTPAGHWGSSLDVHIGDFGGTGQSDILLYDRIAGTLQLLSLNPDLSINQHVTISNIGTDWELYVGRFGAQRSGLFMYKRFAISDPTAVTAPAPTPATNQPLSNTSTGPADPSSTPIPSPTPTPSPTTAPTTAPTPTAVPTPTPVPTQPPIIQSCPTPTATSTPAATATKSPTGSPTVVPTPTATAPATSVPTAVPTPTTPTSATPAGTTTPAPTAAPTPVTVAPATACPTPTPTPTASPTASPTATTTVVPTSTPTATPTAAPTATAAPTPTPVPTSTPTAAPTANPSPTAKPSPTGTVSPAVTSTPTPSPVPSPTPTTTATATSKAMSFALLDPSPQVVPNAGNTDLSGSSVAEWEKQGRSANILLLDFNSDFSVRDRQSYTLWHANWEVYVGRFVSAQQDGLYLYDRAAGEGRLMDFDANLLVGDYHELHNLKGNWEVYSGDFANAGRSQMLLYDPGKGNAQIMSFDEHLAYVSQKTYSGFGRNQVLYIGHFGMPSLSVMLYDPQHAQSTFVAFDQSLDVEHEYLVHSWDQHHQILVGSFIDHARCQAGSDCSKSDDILVLNRQNGQIEQYVFTFGRKFQLYDNRTQALNRLGVSTDQTLNTVDTTTFNLLGTVKTDIKNEELY